MSKDTLKTRMLDECYIVVHQVKTKVNTMYDGRLCIKDAYTLFGVNIYGKRKLLYYGIKFNDDSSFWLDTMQNLKIRGVRKVVYMLLNDYDHSKRAAEINFPNVKIYKSPYLLIDKTKGYIPSGYRDNTQYHIRNLYTQIDVNDYRKELLLFKELNFNKLYLKILLEKELEDIENYYNIDYNIRKLIFSCNFIRNYKQNFNKTQTNSDKVCNLNEIVNSFYNLNKERNMVLNRLEYEELINKLCENNNLGDIL